MCEGTYPGSSRGGGDVRKEASQARARLEASAAGVGCWAASVRAVGQEGEGTGLRRG